LNPPDTKWLAVVTADLSRPTIAVDVVNDRAATGQVERTSEPWSLFFNKVTKQIQDVLKRVVAGDRSEHLQLKGIKR